MDRTAFREAGVELLSYLGQNAFFAAADAGRLDAASPALAEVSLAYPVAPVWKLHPLLAAEAEPDWAILPGRTLTDRAAVAAYVVFFADVAPLEAEASIDAGGGLVRSRLRTVNGLVVEMPWDRLKALAELDIVQWIEPALPPLDAVNNSNRQLTQAEVVQAAPYGLSGAGVTVLVYDVGTGDPTHSDFAGRLTPRDLSPESMHATHVAGTIGGDGTASAGLYRGMAPATVIESYGYQSDQTGTPFYTNPGDLERDYDEAFNVLGADLANNSIGSNVCVNGLDCQLTGDYDVTAQVIDAIIRGELGAPARVVWAAGNERGCLRCRAIGPHTAEGYRSMAPPACAKNPITVGAVNSNDDTITSFTSWGPTDDGRVKPDVCAPGCQTDEDYGVTSPTYGHGDDAYAAACGTSMAAPTVTGLAALLLEDFRAWFPDRPDPSNAAVKALLVHNAHDIAQPGPDYRSGYGSVRIADTIDFMRGGGFTERAVDQDASETFLVRVEPGTTELKLTLAWDDVPATPNVVPALVNDLELRVLDPSAEQHFPWTLDSQLPDSPARRTQPDHRNNIEQVVADAPTPGLWRVEVHGYAVPSGWQAFALCGSPRLSPDCDLDGTPDDEQIAADPTEDCTGDGTLDACEADCDSNGIADSCDIDAGLARDCNANQMPDHCEPWADCNSNGVFDACDVEAGAADCDLDRRPDECEPDCNANGVADDCDLAADTSADCNANAVPDVCDLTAGSSLDCNANQQPDECDLAEVGSRDCNGNGVPDECDLAAGSSPDCDSNGLPDECLTAFDPVVGLSRLDGRDGFAMPGVAEDELLGAAVAGAGDLNADGFGDLVIGVVGGRVAGVGTPGRAYVVFGRPEVGAEGSLDLAALDGVTGVVINGSSDKGRFGAAVAGGGDVNADGIDDLIIGAYQASPTGRYQAGKSYVIFGAADLGAGGALNVSTLDGSNGFVLNGARVGDQCGISVSGADDVNADGVDDLLIGAWLADPDGQQSSGQAYVVFGGASVGQGGSVDLGALDGSNGLAIFGTAKDAWLGYRVAAAGDLNADGVDDLAVSATGASLGGKTRAGAVFVIFGGPQVGVGGTLNLADLSGANGFRVLGSSANDAFGTGLAAGGDVNADGVVDLIIGAPNVNLPNRRSAGAAYVVFGGPAIGVGGWLPASALEGRYGAVVHGIDAADAAGVSVAGAGDLNRDGIADMVVGAFGGDAGTEYQAGELFLLFGSPGFGSAGALDLAGLDGANGFVVQGAQLGDQTAWSLASTGDLNGDGVDDLACGAPYAHRAAGPLSGAAYVLFGRTDPADCDTNGVPDACDLSAGLAVDVLPVGGDGIPDGCQTDCNANGLPDRADVLTGAERDCNHNALPDTCDLASGWSTDILPPGGDGVLDDCQDDCNINGVPDALDLQTGGSSDCNRNALPDECDVASGEAQDCNTNGVPDTCDLASLISSDCNTNNVPDECDVAAGVSADCNANVVPDECETDCNDNAVPDDCDIASGASPDVDRNGVPDECHNILRVPGEYAGIQAALDAALAGDTVLLADGHYPGNHDLTFRGKAILLASENGPADCTVAGVGRGGFGPVFAFRRNEPPEAHIRGLTITNGFYFYGGGIYIDSGAPTISDCIIRDNESLADGGGVYCYNGSAPKLQRCLVEDNLAGYSGGGLAAAADSLVALYDCAIRGNIAADGGGLSFLAGQPILDGCTVVNNTATGSGGGVFVADGQVSIRNCILWGNAAGGGLELSLASAATVSVAYSDVAGGAAAVQVGPGSVLNWQVGNLTIDPLFGRGGVHLRQRSPCRNAGDPGPTPLAGRLDLDRQPRVQEGRVDIGADEVAVDWGVPDNAVPFPPRRQMSGR